MATPGRVNLQSEQQGLAPGLQGSWFDRVGGFNRGSGGAETKTGQMRTTIREAHAAIRWECRNRSDSHQVEPSGLDVPSRVGAHLSQSTDGTQAQRVHTCDDLVIWRYIAPKPKKNNELPNLVNLSHPALTAGDDRILQNLPAPAHPAPEDALSPLALSLPATPLSRRDCCELGRKGSCRGKGSLKGACSGGWEPDVP